MGNNFKTQNSVQVYEIDGIDSKYAGEKEIKEITFSDNDNKNFVNITVNGTEFTVIADEVIRAVENCKRAHR